MVEECDAKTCCFIRNIVKKFACTVNLKSIKWKDLLDHFSNLLPEDCEDHQEKLLNSTIENEIILKYPVKKSYQLAFLKHLIREAEECNVPLDSVYDLYVKLLTSPDGGYEDCFNHYFLKDKSIVIKENKHFISGGTTGLCTWEAGKALANWSFRQRDLFKGKKVLELGCGSGLTGLAIVSSASPPIKYIFTDCHPLVLDQLRFNLNINISGKDWPRLKDNTVVDVIELNWEDTTDNNLEILKEADLVVGADIVYDKNLILSLSMILEKLLDDKAKTAVIACTVRNQETVDSFITAIKSKGLQIEQDSSSYPSIIEGNYYSPVNIYLIKK